MVFHEWREVFGSDVIGGFGSDMKRTQLDVGAGDQGGE